MNHSPEDVSEELDVLQVWMRTKTCCYLSAFASICSEANVRLCCVSEQRCENSRFYVIQSNKEDFLVSPLIDSVAQLMERRQQTRGAVTSENNEVG